MKNSYQFKKKEVKQMEELLIKEAMQTLKKQKRPELIECPVYGRYSSHNRTFVYSDSEQNYQMHTSIPSSKVVRSVKAFANVISEELKRRENPSGFKATVSINLNGGYFVPDDDFGGDCIKFDRLNSQQWNLVKSSINRDMTHKDFLMFLQALKPSIDNFAEIYRSYATLRMVGKTEIVSNPIFTEDGQGSSYSCRYKLEDGTDGEEKYPSGFLADVQFAKAGDKYYSIPLDLLFYRDEDNELMISVLCPTFENIEEQAIIDEADYIKEKTETYSDLLVLSDF